LSKKVTHRLLRSTVPATGENAFTLLELLVVSTLIAIMLAVSVPAFRTSLFTDQLRQAARRVVGTINEARQAAIGSRNGCFINLDLNENQLSYDCPEPPTEGETDTADEDKPERVSTLPSPVRITSIWKGTEQNVTTGEISLWINQNGQMDQMIINLTDGEKELALVSSVFVATIRLEDKSMSPADLETN
jgi:prepilin-type N-terminal cleavage/methylation domain-containing protein